MLRRGLALALLALVAFLTLPGAARADEPGAHTVPVAVLAFDSQGAEEQADALTGALRGAVRGSTQWSLIETNQALGMLTAALKCPSRPPPECQEKIAQQLKAERYIWGFVQKGPTTGQVTAVVHLYQKGKPDTVVRESYAENLKDPNDEKGARKIAQRILDRLGGSAVGIIVVHASGQEGEVIVDGEKRVPLENGSARIEIVPGGHSVEVARSGGSSTKQNVLVTAGHETVVEVAPAPVTEPPREEEKSHFPTRKVLGGVGIGAGLALGALAVEQFLLYNEFQDRGDRIASERIPQGEGPCGPNADKEFCDLDAKTKTASAISIASTAIGGALIIGGAYLFFSGDDSSEERPEAKTRLVPTFGKSSGGFVLSGSF